MHYPINRTRMPKGETAMILPVMQLAEINGVELEVWDHGSGEPVVFVHGGMGDECYAMLAEPALTSRYRLIHYHRRGWGKSQRLEAPLTIAQQAADCRAVMHHLGVERAHMVGQSYGAVIHLQSALDAPDAVHTLALLEPALPAILFNAPEFMAVAGKAGSLFAAGDKAGATDAFGQEVAGADYRAGFDQTLPPGYFERWVADADTNFLYDTPALGSWTFTREQAAQIAQPVINMRGANTRPYMQEAYETMRMWLPQAENFVVPQATHAMLQTNPKAVAERLASFFSSHRLES
jgi:pimeloyl-ACP methyl ester carboxylesterase